MLKELERRKQELERKADELRKDRDNLHLEATRWSEERDKLNSRVRELLELAQKYKKMREKYNEKVSKSKAKKEEYERKAKFFYTKGEELRKKNNLKPGPSLYKLSEEVNHLEFIQQTQVMTPERERRLVERIAALRKEMKQREAELNKYEDLKSALEKASSFRAQALKEKHNVTKLARAAQEYHDRMVLTYKEVDRLRKEADEAHKKFLDFHRQADKAHKNFLRLQREVKNFDKIISGLQKKPKAKAEAEAEKIYEQFKQGAKLDTEDLMLLQRSRLL
jgi:uncharacterized coiled-coil DUF342 family protein